MDRGVRGAHREDSAQTDILAQYVRPVILHYRVPDPLPAENLLYVPARYSRFVIGC